MIRMLGAFMFLGLASALPVQQTAAQDVLGGAIVGGALGGIIGGALGRGGGAIAGAAIGATTGAVIAAEAQRRSSLRPPLVPLLGFCARPGVTPGRASGSYRSV